MTLLKEKQFHITYFVTKDTRHANYSIAGLLELERKNLLEINFRPAPYYSKNRLNVLPEKGVQRSFRPYPWSPEMIVENKATRKKVRIAVDLQDWDYMFSYHSLKHCDFVFKRAYTDKSRFASEYFNVPILPAGINHSASISAQSYSQVLQYHKRLHNITYALENPKELIRYLKARMPSKKSTKINAIKKLPDVNYLTKPPTFPYVFFQVEFHSWNNKESERINNTRAAVIRTLRKELGEQFIGGMFFRHQIAPEYADCITNVPFQRDIYLQFVQQAAVVISTNGFGDSIPWKLPEYMQLSKCVIAEKLIHELPVALSESELLFFDKIEECPALCHQLLQNEDRRIEMGRNAQIYYQQHVNPSNSLLRMLNHIFKD